jgi:hypothetical protein
MAMRKAARVRHIREACCVCSRHVQESLVPLTINCWPSVSGGESYVNIEYESQSELDLQNVQIVIPVPPTGASPTVNQVWAAAQLAGLHPMQIAMQKYAGSRDRGLRRS